MNEAKEKNVAFHCYLVTIEVDYEQPEFIKCFGDFSDAEAFRAELESYQRAKPAWPDDSAPQDDFVRFSEASDAWLDAHPGGRNAGGAERFGIITVPFVPPKPHQDKQTYLIGYSHPRGAGRSFETLNGQPTPEDIEALENRIEARNGIPSVSITSISRIANSSDEPTVTASDIPQ